MKKSIKERKVDEILKWRGATLKVSNEVIWDCSMFKKCAYCFFRTNNYPVKKLNRNVALRHCKNFFKCDSENRSDGISIYYKLIEKAKKDK